MVTLSRDGTVRLWDVDSGAEIATLKTRAGGFRYVSFNSESDKVFTIDGERSIRAWPLDPLPVALSEKPRDLTPAEKDLYGIRGTLVGE